MSPEQMQDVLDCGTPQQLWTVTIAYLESRARQSEEIAISLERDAKDAQERADEHHEAAQQFHLLALAMKDAPILFPAQAIEAQRAETVKQGSVADESAVRESECAQTIPPKQDRDYHDKSK